MNYAPQVLAPAEGFGFCLPFKANRAFILSGVDRKIIGPGCWVKQNSANILTPSK